MTVTLWGRLERAGSVPIASRPVRLALASAAFDGTGWVTTDVSTVYTDAAGLWRFDGVDPNDTLDPAGTHFKLTLPGEDDPFSLVITSTQPIRPIPGTAVVGVWWRDAWTATPPQPVPTVLGIRTVNGQGPNLAGDVTVAGGGGAVTFTAVAATVLSGHRVVREQAGTVATVSNTAPAATTADLLLTTQAAEQGAAVTVHAFGPITDPSWNWAPGPVWLGLDGLLTQTAPTGPVVLRRVGTALASTVLFFSPQPALQLV